MLDIHSGEPEYVVNLDFYLDARLLNRNSSGGGIKTMMRLVIIFKLIEVQTLMRLTFTH